MGMSRAASRLHSTSAVAIDACRQQTLQKIYMYLWYFTKMYVFAIRNLHCLQHLSLLASALTFNCSHSSIRPPKINHLRFFQKKQRYKVGKKKNSFTTKTKYNKNYSLTYTFLRILTTQICIRVCADFT